MTLISVTENVVT